MESNPKVIKVVKTCCSGRIRCSPLSYSAFPLALAGVCLCCCHQQLDWGSGFDLCLHDSLEFWAMGCLLCWFVVDGSRLSGYSESEINAACIYSLFAHLPGKSWTQM